MVCACVRVCVCHREVSLLSCHTAPGGQRSAAPPESTVEMSRHHFPPPPPREGTGLIQPDLCVAVLQGSPPLERRGLWGAHRVPFLPHLEGLGPDQYTSTAACHHRGERYYCPVQNTYTHKRTHSRAYARSQAQEPVTYGERERG